jgi:hypothetical protein
MFSRSRMTCGLLGVALLAWATIGTPALMAASIPLALTGFNADVVDENAATFSAVRFDGGTAAWFEAGLMGHTDGLPSSRVFVNDGSNGTTNTGTTFMFQPYTGNNVLRLLSGATSGTLTLVNPGSFTNLAILASSGSGGGTGNAVLHFSNGTTQNITYSAVDWNQNSNPPGPAAIGNLGRNENVGAAGTSFTYGKPVPFAMYETDINLLGLGLSNLTLTSVDFNGLAGSAAVTGIFALSATPTPEPSTLILCGLGGLGLLGFAWRRSRIAVP